MTRSTLSAVQGREELPPNAAWPRQPDALLAVNGTTRLQSPARGCQYRLSPTCLPLSSESVTLSQSRTIVDRPGVDAQHLCLLGKTASQLLRTPKQAFSRILCSYRSVHPRLVLVTRVLLCGLDIPEAFEWGLRCRGYRSQRCRDVLWDIILITLIW
jgi:hypothetical protein